MSRHDATTNVSTSDLFSGATCFPITSPTEPPPHHSRGSDSQIFVASFIPPKTIKPRSGLRSRCQRTPKGIIRYLPDGTLWKCVECKTIYTPVRRSGSRGVASLCNACGLRRSKTIRKGENGLRRAIAKNGKKKPTAIKTKLSVVNKKAQAKRSTSPKLKTSEQRLHLAAASQYSSAAYSSGYAKESWKPVTNPESPVSLAQSNLVFGHRDIATHQAPEKQVDSAMPRAYIRKNKQEAPSCRGRQKMALSHYRQQQSPERHVVPQAFKKEPTRQHINRQYQVPRQFEQAKVCSLQHQYMGHDQLRKQEELDSLQHQQMHQSLQPPKLLHCLQELNQELNHPQHQQALNDSEQQQEIPYHLSPQQMPHRLQPQSASEHFDEHCPPQELQQRSPVYSAQQLQKASPASTKWKKQDTSWTNSYEPISDYTRLSDVVSDEALPVSEVLASMSLQSGIEEVDDVAMHASGKEVDQGTSHVEIGTPSEETNAMQTEIQQCLQSMADNFGAQEENLQRLNDVQIGLLADRNINHAVADANREIVQLRALLNGSTQLMRRFANRLPEVSSSTYRNKRLDTCP